MDPTEFFDEIRQEEISDIRQIVEEEGVKCLPEFLEKKKREWLHVPLAIALVGEAAVGKSTFINSVRGLTADDPGAAPVGTGDVTQTPTSYPHPYNNNVVFWDLPGVGTPRFPMDESYLGRVRYSQYDFFLLLSDDRFSANDVWLAQNIEKLGKRYFFVRTKIDDTMYSANSSQTTFSCADVLQNIHEHCEKNFRAAQLNNKSVYCISNYEQDKWDFNKLMDDILVSLPEIKRNALVLSLSPLSKSVIKRKSNALRRHAVLIAMLSGAQSAGASLIPVPCLGGAVSVSLDLALLIVEVGFYLKQYGLDDESLTELSKKTNMTLDYYKNALKVGSVMVSTRQSMKVILMKLMKAEAIETVATKASVECIRWIPILGAAAGGAASFASSLYLLHTIINNLEGDAMHLIEAIIEATSTRV